MLGYISVHTLYCLKDSLHWSHEFLFCSCEGIGILINCYVQQQKQSLKSPHFELLELVGQQHSLNDDNRDSSSSCIHEFVRSSHYIHNFMSLRTFATVTILITFMIKVLCSLHYFVDLVSVSQKDLNQSLPSVP